MAAKLSIRRLCFLIYFCALHLKRTALVNASFGLPLVPNFVKEVTEVSAPSIHFFRSEFYILWQILRFLQGYYSAV